MATIVLQAVGTVVGGIIGGPIGAALGSAAGAAAGAAIDRSLFASTQRSEGPRLEAIRVMEADEGAGIPRLYGTARIAGQVIWATRFEEDSDTERQGGKGGGPKVEVTTYSYYANFAVGLCEGPIAGIRRIWADGEELDRSDHAIRVYRGDEAQAPDPLIEARQGVGNAPAYRGLAYVVFDRLALERWGNRIPQIACEVLRPVGELETRIEAVTIIPGASEHGLDPEPVRERVGDGEDRLINRNVLFAESDWAASMEEMTALMPALERAALIVSWFGDDLRAGHCRLRPKVEVGARDESEDWRVGDLDRGEALTVSRSAGGPAYGGTPSDAGVLRAIADLKARGLAVTYYPFLLMDVPAGNGLPDPYGGAEQAAYPWRGRLTLDRAETRPGTGDRTIAARTDIAVFLGTVGPDDFSWDGDRLRYHGPDEWSYRRMIFHQAHLAARAGVDAFVIGSELRGLTRLRDQDGRFPFVEGLIAIAEAVKALMPGATVTYAADWTEYAAYRPQDGSGDVYFNLDPLWASDAIDVVGIDNYLPLADFRDHGDPAGGVPSPYDRKALKDALSGGEWYDWYYASEADREASLRSPITDGAAGTPFVYRDKDIAGWWASAHVERRGGVETGQASPWVPASKPIWLTELGCPAIDRGANQPNVFVDPKSAESFVPYHSAGVRDDLAQRRFLEVSLTALKARPAGSALNPLSPVYGGPMLPAGTIHVWTWDARPYPAFPGRSDLWSDGGNWRLGHWLTGRLANAPADALVAAILADHGITGFDTSKLETCLDGYVVPGPRTAREDIEAILRLIGAVAFQSGETLVFSSPSRRVEPVLVDALAERDGPLVELRRGEAGERPDEVAISHLDPERAYQPAVAEAVRAGARHPRTGIVTTAAILNAEAAERLARERLGETVAGLDTLGFDLAPSRAGIEAGDVLSLQGREGRWQVTRIEEAETRRIETRRHVEIPPPLASPAGAPTRLDPARPVVASRPAVLLLDLPLSPLEAGGGASIAVLSRPFLRSAVLVGALADTMSRRAVVERPATIGVLLEPLEPGPAAIFDRRARITVKLGRGALSSVTMRALYEGRNLAAILAPDGRLEVVQFAEAEEVAVGTFVLKMLLRGQGGTEGASARQAPAGSRFVLLDRAVLPLGLTDAEIDRPLAVRVAPLGRPADDPASVTLEARLGLGAVRPLAPVHLRARHAPDGALQLSWIRRTRIGGDSWEAGDVPLGEASEAYRAILTVPGQEGRLVRRTAEPALSLSAGDLEAAFGTRPETLSVSLAQLSAVWGAGTEATVTVTRPA